MNRLVIEYNTLEELTATLLAHAGSILAGGDNIQKFILYVGRFDPNAEKGGEK